MKSIRKSILLTYSILLILFLSCKEDVKYDYDAYKKHLIEIEQTILDSLNELTIKYNSEYQWDTLTYSNLEEFDKVINTEYQIIENARVDKIIKNESTIIRIITGYMPWYCFDLELIELIEQNELKNLECKPDNQIAKHYSLVVQIESLFKGEYEIEKFQSDENREINVKPDDYHFYGKGKIIEVKTFSVMQNAPVIGND